MLSPRRILRWMYIGRVSVGVAIFVAALSRWRNVDAGDTLAATLALFCAIAFTSASAWLSSSSQRLGPSFFLAQSLFDLGLVTTVVHLTGSDASQFTALYILVITVGSLVLPFAGGLLVAAIGIAMYWIDAIWGLGFALPIGVALHLGVFAIVGFGSAYISARLRQAGAGKEELEAQLVLARLQADDILRNIGSGIITVDEAGRVLYANPSAGRMLGVTAESLIGKQVARSLAENAPGLAAALERTVRERIRIHRGEAVITSSGRRFAIGLTTTTIEGRTEQSGVSATAIFQDITDNKRLEELRLRTERLEGVAELSASLAHEIKNPLASIRSAVEQLAASPRATEDDEVLGKLIVRESDRLSRLLSEFLDFARVRVTLVDRVDIGAIAKTATSLAATHPDCRRGVQVTCVAPQDPLLVEGDEDLLHRAVFNIALNAVQAVSERGSVKVDVSRLPLEQVPRGTPFQQDAIALRVTDNGPGIPDDIRERVFDPFFTTKSGGTGLGLPIAHRAIDAHRGILLVESTANGTQFTVLLPHSPFGAGVPA
ncbi:MAG: two-component system sensor histidine kinase NtrB [Gemmatimonadaceae bacterium]